MIFKTIIRYFLVIGFQIVLILSVQAPAFSEWLYYDEGEATHAGSSLRFQGVRFSLPDDIIRAPLLQVAFFYVTDASFCPIKIHITDHSHSTSIADRIYSNAVNGWNYLDLSSLGTPVPHNFYVILENRGKCGFPMLDDNDLSERSFKGNYLKSMKTRLSHDLLIRAEVGEAWEIAVLKEWDVSIREKITVKQRGAPKETILEDFMETWTLFADNSFTAENSIYGLWKQKGKKFGVSLDLEEIRTYLMDVLSDKFINAIADVIVTKIQFTGKISTDETINGTFRIFAKISFPDDSAVAANMSLERKFRGIPVQLPEPETIFEQQ